MSAADGLPASISINSTMEEANRISAREGRRLYLYGQITSVDEQEIGFFNSSIITNMIEDIFYFNRIDTEIDPEDREPIIIYINSPGGDLIEGFALISAMEISKTPIYTVNVGAWSSMSFLIGITGTKRYSLPYMTFLMHDGFGIAGGSMNKMQDKMEFDRRFEEEVVKKHVLKHSKMNSDDYDMLRRVELYMLPEDALRRGFIDEIVTDINTIL